MNTIYLLGGPPRCGKTTIMQDLAKRKPVQLISADAVEHGLRNVLIGKPHQMLRHIELSGKAEYKSSLTEGGELRPFSNSGTETELTMQAVVGMFDHYRRENTSVAVEATAITPAWASQLNIPGATIKAAFVGYTRPDHITNILTHAANNSHDWINEWLAKEGGDDTKIREWAAQQADKCIDLKAEASKYGYPFFDISELGFEDYLKAVKAYFG